MMIDFSQMPNANPELQEAKKELPIGWQISIIIQKDFVAVRLLHGDKVVLELDPDSQDLDNCIEEMTDSAIDIQKDIDKEPPTIQ